MPLPLEGREALSALHHLRLDLEKLLEQIQPSLIGRKRSLGASLVPQGLRASVQYLFDLPPAAQSLRIESPMTSTSMCGIHGAQSERAATHG